MYGAGPVVPPAPAPTAAFDPGATYEYAGPPAPPPSANLNLPETRIPPPPSYRLDLGMFTPGATTHSPADFPPPPGYDDDIMSPTGTAITA